MGFTFVPSGALRRHTARAGLAVLLVGGMLAFAVALSEGGAPRSEGRYAGDTSDLFGISFRVTRNGTLIRALDVAVVARCRDGGTETTIFGLRPISISRAGRFNEVQHFTEPRTKAVVRVAGRFRRRGASVVGRLRTFIRRTVGAKEERRTRTCRGAIRFKAELERSARTGVGSLKQLKGSAGCMRGRRAQGCARVRGLSDSWSAAVSPDGRNVYVTGDDPGQVVVFKRDQRTGALRQLRGARGCISEGGQLGCAAARGLAGAHTVVVASDGRHVYALGYTSVVVMRRNPRSGSLSQLAGAAGCLNGSGDDGCAPARGLPPSRSYLVEAEPAADVTLTSDGRHAYVLAASGADPDTEAPHIDTITVLARNAATGMLSQPRGSIRCIAQIPLEGCKRARRLDTDLASIYPSPDGRHLYVGAWDPSLQLLARDRRSGALHEVAGRRGCFAGFGGDASCARLRGDGGDGLAVSGDGRNVYLVGRELTIFRRRAATGALRQLPGSAGCLADDGGAGCAPTRALNVPDAVALTPDGHTAYASSFGNSVAVFARTRQSGGLRQLHGARGCLASRDFSDEDKSCARPRGRFFPVGLAVSPDGKNVYVVSARPGAVSVFERRRP